MRSSRAASIISNPAVKSRLPQDCDASTRSDKQVMPIEPVSLRFRSRCLPSTGRDEKFAIAQRTMIYFGESCLVTAIRVGLGTYLGWQTSHHPDRCSEGLTEVVEIQYYTSKES